MELQMLWLYSGRLTLADNVPSIADGGTTENYNTNNKQKLIL